MKVRVEKSKVQETKGTTLVLFATAIATDSADSKRTKKATKKTKPKSADKGKVSWSIQGMTPELSQIASPTPLERFSGKAGETVFYRAAHPFGFENLLIVGLGTPNGDDYEAIRRGMSQAIRTAMGEKLRELTVGLTSLKGVLNSSSLLAQAMCEGAILTAQGPHTIKGQSNESSDKSGVNEVTFLVESNAEEKTFAAGIHRGQILAESVLFARYLGDLPGNYMTPTLLGQEVQKAAKGLKGVKVTVWDKARIKKERMGGLLGVASGSDQPPTFTMIEYNGAPKTKGHVAFVGKGLTFDCGGISIKPALSMEEMKFDMCGGATVIATVLALAKLGAKVNAIAYIPSTENLTGGSATKPGDILTIRNGKTVEVNNTDAEGRLILADALVYASEQKPKAIIDAATLTGAMVIALGNVHTGVYSKDSDLVVGIKKASDSTGELVWHMPLTEAHSSDMAGTYADLSNISSSRGAGSATAAAFLENFVGKDIPWAHFDIAGTAQNVGGRLPYCPTKGASGAMVRTFVELAQSL